MKLWKCLYMMAIFLVFFPTVSNTADEIESEAALISATDGRVVRTSPDTLQITLENGEKVILKNFWEDPDGTDQIGYVYSGFDEISGCYLIDLRLYEAIGVLAVNAKDGTQKRLIGFPTYNPSKNMFFCVHGGEGLLDPVIEIYRLENMKITNIFREFPPWGFENAVWKNDTTIGLEAQRYFRTDSGPPEIVRGKTTIQFSDGSWQIIPPDFYEIK